MSFFLVTKGVHDFDGTKSLAVLHVFRIKDLAGAILRGTDDERIPERHLMPSMDIDRS